MQIFAKLHLSPAQNSSDMRRKIALLSCFFVAFMFIFPTITHAEGDQCELKITKYLKRVGSPMVGSAKNFAEVAKRNNLDCYLLPSIAGVESTFGKNVPRNSFNPFGWNNGKYAFTNWDHAILVVGNTLGEKYVKRWAARTPEQIGRYYAADPAWPRKVRSFMLKISSQPL